jgi:hypothetical protein
VCASFIDPRVLPCGRADARFKFFSFFSCFVWQYVAGTTQQALEIFNPLCASVSLSGARVVSAPLFGAWSFNNSIDLSNSTINGGSPFVVCQASASYCNMVAPSFFQVCILR